MYALNIKACNHYKLYNGTAAEVELKALANAAGTHLGSIDNDLIRHNVAVFRNGENALQVEFFVACQNTPTFDPRVAWFKIENQQFAIQRIYRLHYWF